MKKVWLALVPFVLSTALFFALWRLQISDSTTSLIFAFLLELLLLGHILLVRMEHVHATVDDVVNVRGLANVPADIQNAKRMQVRFNPRLVDGLITEFATDLAQLGQGRQRLSPDRFMSIANVIYQELKQGDTLTATSYFAGGDYWKERYGAEYARLNQEAHQRGAFIQRIFVLRDAQHLQEKHEILLAQQKFVDVHVCVLSENPLMPDEHRDFFVINEDLAAEFHFSPSQVLLYVDLVSNKAEVARLRALMGRIMARRATRFEGPGTKA